VGTRDVVELVVLAALWGALFLGEAITFRMVAGAGIVLAGTALATGMVNLPAGPAGLARRANR